LEDFEEDELPNDRFAVFLVATFGEGEPTDNAAKFCEWLRSKDREPGLCNSMNFAVRPSLCPACIGEN
jgi:NADPH-ferrihemoprotein reductase